MTLAPKPRTPQQLLRDNNIGVHNPTFPVIWPEDWYRVVWPTLTNSQKGKYTEIYCAILASPKHHSFVNLVDSEAGARGEICDVMVYMKKHTRHSDAPDASQPMELSAPLPTIASKSTRQCVEQITSQRLSRRPQQMQLQTRSLQGTHGNQHKMFSRWGNTYSATVGTTIWDYKQQKRVHVKYSKELRGEIHTFIIHDNATLRPIYKIPFDVMQQQGFIGAKRNEAAKTLWWKDTPPAWLTKCEIKWRRPEEVNEAAELYYKQENIAALLKKAEKEEDDEQKEEH